MGLIFWCIYDHIRTPNPCCDTSTCVFDRKWKQAETFLKLEASDWHASVRRGRIHAIHVLVHAMQWVRKACVHSGRQLWCQLSLIRGLFSDLMPGQAWKEVTFSKVCLKEMTCGCSGMELHSTTTTHRCQKSNCACFLFSWFLLLFPKMQHSARENTVIVCSNAGSNPRLYPEIPIWSAGLEFGIMLMLI